MYRFRTINNILGEYTELEKQEIFLQSLDKLNDPMEGVMDVYFKGDEIVWRSLLNHYIRCLEDTVYSSLYLEDNDEEVNLLRDIQILKREPSEIEKQIMAKDEKEMLEEQEKMFIPIKNKFFSHNIISELAENLSKINRPIRKEELLFYLRLIHPFAFDAVNSVFVMNGIMKKANILSETNIKEFTIKFEVIYKFSIENDENKCEKFFQSLNQADEQIKLFYICNNLEKKFCKKTIFILNGFSKSYLEQLDKLLYPKWYTACFMTDYRNSSVWGNYGNNHTGVCLKFKTKEKDGKKYITLNNSSGKKCEFELRKINYQNKFAEINFFKSLGALPKLELQSKWFTDDKGNISKLFSSMENWNNEWIKSHRESFNSIVTTKTNDWNYENEYRIVLPDLLGGDFIEDNTRKFRYDFNDLEGIIFGIKTSEVNKIEIMRIIREKCIKENRKDFKFYQAEYSHSTGKICANELKIIKF